ncbi:MAG TPA: PA domain-containing protein [Egibacteraceae bacterium]|nr:PA domain-containing protein [Egibacteraceae bacterium]
MHATRRLFGATLTLAVLLSLLSAPASADHPDPADAVADDGVVIDPKAQHGPQEGHLPASSENVQLVGRLDTLATVPGGIADVAAHRRYAYLGAFRPECTALGGGGTGVHVVDIRNPAKPTKVAFIPAHPNSYVGEGVFVMAMSTPSFTGDILIHNNEPCDSTQPYVGGVSLWDVTDPRNPRPLALEAGDFTLPDGSARIIHGKPTAAASHSAQGWTVGDRAYLAMVNNPEARDVDILDITDPRNPVQIAEVGLPDWPAAVVQGHGDNPHHHDMQINFIDGHWYLLVSYWDAGHVLLNVDDPANPVYVGQTRFFDPDPFTGLSPPTGNAHQAYWSSDNRFILGTDENFNPYRLVPRITSGPFAGEVFTAVPAPGAAAVTPDAPLSGPTRFVGLACDPATVPPAQSAEEIAVIERGVCAFQVKAQNIIAAGYAGGVVFNAAAAGACEALVNMLITDSNVPMIFVPRSAGYRILGIEGYVPANCPAGPNPPLPAVGTGGQGVDIRSIFQGWGHTTLYDARTLQPIDAYAVPEALDPAFAQGFGNLTVHEVKTDPRAGVNMAYLSYYAAGFRVVAFDETGITEIGHYIAEGGNNFWGVFPVLPGNVGENGRGRGADRARPLILLSDRDSGLWIFRYTGKEPKPRPGPRRP